MSSLPRPERATIINLHTRQAPMQETTTKRGGKREPLPRITITIPNYGRYQEPLTGNARRIWVRFDRTTPNDVRLGRVSLEARWVFAALVMASTEGTVPDVTFRDLAKMIDCRPQTVESAVKKLEAEGLIQTEGKRKSNAPQTVNDALPFEESANDAAPSALQTDITDRQIKDPLTPADAEASPAVETKDEIFLTVTTSSGELWHLTMGRVWDWEQSFPTIGIRQQLLSAASWINDNPTRRKTDYPKFFGNWIRKRLEDGQGGQMRFPVAVAAKPASKLTNQPGGLRDVVL